MTKHARNDVTRSVYDHTVDRYVEAIGTTINPDFESDDDRALLDRFAHELTRRTPGPVLDVGCGPGRVAARLAGLGLDSAGCDISPRMVAAARRAHGHLRFDVAPLERLPVADGVLAGAVYWYSIINTPLDELAAVWSELDRALMPGGSALVAFQAGDNEIVERHDVGGSGLTMTLHRHSLGDVATTLRAMGFDVTDEVCRSPVFAHETTDQAFLTVRAARRRSRRRRGVGAR